MQTGPIMHTGPITGREASHLEVESLRHVAPVFHGDDRPRTEVAAEDDQSLTCRR